MIAKYKFKSILKIILTKCGLIHSLYFSTMYLWWAFYTSFDLLLVKLIFGFTMIFTTFKWYIPLLVMSVRLSNIPITKEGAWYMSYKKFKKKIMKNHEKVD